MKLRFANRRASILGAAFIALFALSAQAETANSDAGKDANQSAGETKADAPPAAKKPRKSREKTAGKGEGDSADNGAKRQKHAGRYENEAQAKAHCGSEIVWISSHDKLVYYPGTPDYGKKPGAYICEKDAAR